MRSSVLFVCFLTFFFAKPAHAVDGSNCAAKAARFKPSERNAYMESCLAQVSSPANVREAEIRHKRALCTQNAKNYKLQGNNRENYIAACINRNEAETAAKAVHQTDARKKTGKFTFAKAGAANPKAEPPQASHGKKREARK